MKTEKQALQQQLSLTIPSYRQGDIIKIWDCPKRINDSNRTNIGTQSECFKNLSPVSLVTMSSLAVLVRVQAVE